MEKLPYWIQNSLNTTSIIVIQNSLHPEPAGIQLIKRYKHNYKIPDEAPVTEDMIMHHWTLEKRLTNELKKSTPETRWDIFEKAYTKLYHELPWLNEYSDTGNQIAPEREYKKWVSAIGAKPKLIYEIGTGKGKMIQYLDSIGYTCKGTEITKERGEKYLSGSKSVQLGNTDGIHLDQFEEKNSYDIVLSNQVIEHLHPDDKIAHFKGVHAILKQGGHYIFSTPHVLTGPHDVSRVFEKRVAEGMHLKEYSFSELAAIAKEAGFKKISLAVNLPLFKQLYFAIFLLSEKMLLQSSNLIARKKNARLLQKARLFSGDIFLKIQK